MAILLLVSGIFNIVVWPTFFRRVAKDTRARDAAGKPTRFLIVHAVLVGAALVLGVASAVVGVIGLTS